MGNGIEKITRALIEQYKTPDPELGEKVGTIDEEEATNMFYRLPKAGAQERALVKDLYENNVPYYMGQLGLTTLTPEAMELMEAGFASNKIQFTRHLTEANAKMFSDVLRQCQDAPGWDFVFTKKPKGILSDTSILSPNGDETYGLLSTSRDPNVPGTVYFSELRGWGEVNYSAPITMPSAKTIGRIADMVSGADPTFLNGAIDQEEYPSTLKYEAMVGNPFAGRKTIRIPLNDAKDPSDLQYEVVVDVGQGQLDITRPIDFSNAQQWHVVRTDRFTGKSEFAPLPVLSPANEKVLAKEAMKQIGRSKWTDVETPPDAGVALNPTYSVFVTKAGGWTYTAKMEIDEDYHTHYWIVRTNNQGKTQETEFVITAR